MINSTRRYNKRTPSHKSVWRSLMSGLSPLSSWVLILICQRAYPINKPFCECFTLDILPSWVKDGTFPIRHAGQWGVVPVTCWETALPDFLGWMGKVGEPTECWVSPWRKARQDHVLGTVTWGSDGYTTSKPSQNFKVVHIKVRESLSFLPISSAIMLRRIAIRSQCRNLLPFASRTFPQSALRYGVFEASDWLPEFRNSIVSHFSVQLRHYHLPYRSPLHLLSMQYDPNSADCQRYFQHLEPVNDGGILKGVLINPQIGNGKTNMDF